MQTLEPRIFASEVIQGQPENFTGVEVRGVKVTGKDAEGRETVEVTDTNPDFVSVYLRRTNGEAVAIGDFGSHAEASTWARQLCERYTAHNWSFDCPLTA